jgi:elongation factor G
VHPLPAITTPKGASVTDVACDPAQPLVAEVVRTTTDPYVGRLSLVRVFSGTLPLDETVHVSGHLGDFVGHEVPGHPGHDDDERVGPLGSPFGDTHRPRGSVVAGDIALVSKLSQAETSDTLSSVDRPAVVAPWLLPEPQLPVAIRAATKSDEDKLGTALQRIVAEDVTMRMEHATETDQVVLWTMGQAHVDDILDRLQERFGVSVTAEPYRTALRETFVRKVAVQGRHVKQSGGHGQFAVCQIEIEPLPRGAGFEFVDKVVGGAVPRQFIPSVEKGARNQLDKGLISGHPVVDVRVTLLDGKAHSVDSSDMAFQTAAALALREAANETTMALLEPIDKVSITIADEYLGAVMADLRGRRGQVVGTAPAEEAGWTVVHAEVPQAELSRYPIELRSVSHGTGSFIREPLRHDLLPADKMKEYLVH